MHSYLRTVFVCLLVAVAAQAQERPEFRISRAVEPPRIDGVLDDRIWKDDPLPLGDFVSYDPLYGNRMAYRTDIRVSYDDRYLYFSFHCRDSEPERIRTTISRRDNIFNDDWVGLSLDSAGSGQSSYHMMVNPSGIQMDALNTSASGERWDADWVWDSAGRVTEDGYTTEIRVPLTSIRFQGGGEVRMGILFWRRISRLGVSAAWPDIPPGQWVFNRHAQLVFSDLKQPRLFELLPSATYSINQIRSAPGEWGEAANKGDLGLSAKYGITSTITLDATINPDFSQVESDAFQVQVNQRFPIFFSEKRPFFMEGMGLFTLAGATGDGNMITSVHTRRIVNPRFGAKLTGNLGKATFGLLNASDESPTDLSGRAVGLPGQEKVFTIGRVMYGLGESDYIGAILTDTEFNGRHNRVAGGDISLRFRRSQQFNTTFLASDTGSAAAGTKRDIGAQLTYGYNKRRGAFLTQLEHYGRDFVMDTAFYNRTGITNGWAYGELNHYPGEGDAWLRRMTPFIWTRHGRDHMQDGNEHYILPGIRMNFTRQGFFRVDQGFGREPWAGRQFKNNRLRVMGGAQFFRWLNVNGEIHRAFEIFYDPANPFQGRSSRYRASFTFQPSPRFTQNTTYTRVRFDRESNGERVFTVHIANVRNTYQFNKHFFMRAIMQFDSSQRRILTDLLASYELVPGTVVHAGYGSLIRRPGNMPEYFTTNRGLFFKTSYLHRF